MRAGSFDRSHPHHRETQARLVAVEESYQTLVDRLPIATYVMKVGLPASGAMYVSSGIERLTGYPAEEWLGERDLLYEILHPDDQELAAAHWESVVAGGETSFVLVRVKPSLRSAFMTEAPVCRTISGLASSIASS